MDRNIIGTTTITTNISSSVVLPLLQKSLTVFFHEVNFLPT